jgi:ELWxxDGT repeat protein
MALAYFTKYSLNGAQLWVTDGTAGGVGRVALIPDASAAIDDLTAVGARVFFDVDDGGHGAELWTSDGTAAGTKLVKDINPGLSGSFPDHLTNVGAIVYFEADDGVHGQELWKSDGTTAGTVLVKDINPGTNNAEPLDLTNVDGTLYFIASDGVHGQELWKSDGTTAGTVMVKDIDPGSANSDLTDLTDVNGTLFFVATDSANNKELWKSDGTAGGTVVVEGAPAFDPANLTNVDGTLFFTANVGQLWKSDGTAAGTGMVKDIAGNDVVAPSSLTSVNGTLFFQGFDSSDGAELWKSDGTEAGTVRVADINPGANGSTPDQITDVDGIAYFEADDGVHGAELWKSDGTAAGTVLVKDVVPGSDPSFLRDLAGVNGTLAFEADELPGFELFQSDGTTQGTVEAATDIDFGKPLAVTKTAAADFDGDSVSNVLLRNSSGALTDWTMSGSAVTASTLLTTGGSTVNLPAAWTVDGLGDLNGDGRADVLLRNANGSFADWTMNGAQINSSQLITSQGNTVALPAAWSVSGLGDFNGDGETDVLLRNADGAFADWTMNGAQIASSQFVSAQGATVTIPAAWSVAGIGDFNGDDKADVLLRNANGIFADWTMDGSQIDSSQLVTSQGAIVALPMNWTVAGVGDFNGDGLAEVLLRNSDGKLADWTMNGSKLESSNLITSNGAAVTLDPSWSIAALGDLNGDGNTDIMFKNANGSFAEWTMNGSTITAANRITASGQAVAAAAWQAQGNPTDLSIV